MAKRSRLCRIASSCSIASPGRYFLHGTIYPEGNGTEIARYVIHYAGGQQSVRPVRYGEDIRNSIALAADRGREDAVPAWTGTNPLVAENGISVRLYKSAWENPHPDVPVESIDFNSNLTRSAPFLIAITVEE
jgi:hypothetical protein